MNFIKSKKVHPLVLNNYYFRIFGFLSGMIIVFASLERPGKLGAILLFISAFMWPHFSLLLSLKRVFFKNELDTERLNLCIDGFLYGITAYYTSFDLVLCITMWSSNITNSITSDGIRQLFRSLIFLIFGSIVLVPFVEFNVKLYSNTSTTILSLFFLTAYTILTANNLFKAKMTNIIKRKQISALNMKFESELLLARKIQINMLPHGRPNQHMAAFYKPMGQIGGDFYEFINFRDSDNIGIFISDVSGHGVPPALITSMLKYIIHQAGEKRNDPAELLSYINDILKKEMLDNFITAFYGIYNPSSRTFFYSNAGHCIPYIIHDNINQLKGPSNRALVLFKDYSNPRYLINFKNNVEVLHEGSKLLFYTDGLTETRPVDGDAFFEYAKLPDVLLMYKHLDSDSFIQHIYQELVAYRKSDIFDDDICLICLDVK